ncbi:MAG: hypothetical protein AAB425_03815, partial [Bdellovibrionota bacterium]
IKPRPKPLPSAFAVRPVAAPTAAVDETAKLEKEPEPFVPEVLPSPTVLPKISAPSPSPSPIPPAKQIWEIYQIRIVAPKTNGVVELSTKDKDFEKKLNLEFGMRPLEGKVKVALFKLPTVGAREEKIEIENESVEVKRGKGILPVVLTKPGMYEWRILGPDGEPLSPPADSGAKDTTVSQFEFKANLGGIDLFPAMVGNSAVRTSLFGGSLLTDFFVRVRWKARVDVSQFRVLIKDLDTGKTLLDQATEETLLDVMKGEPFDGTVSIQVSAKTKAGFVVTSAIQKLKFDFVAPTLVLPTDKSRHNLDDLMQSVNQGILLTWHKTNFTEAYEIEVAGTENFAKIIFKQSIRENFFVIKAPPKGEYWWRVRSRTGSFASRNSSGYQFTIE